MKRSLLQTLVLIPLTLAMLACGSDEPSNAATTNATEPPPLPADVAKVGEAVAPQTTTTSPLVAANEVTNDTLVATGEFVSPVRSELSPKLPGRVAQMYVDAGAIVSKGQPVLRLETDYTSLQLQQAQAEVARAKAMRDEAARDLERKKGLAASNSIPQATFDRSQAMYDQANAALAGASAQVNMSRQMLADSTLRSPINGVVAEKRTDVGQRLADGGIAFVVVQLSPLKLRFTVPERYLGKIGPGDKVSARVDPYPGENFTGTIKTVGGVIDPQTRTMFAEAEFANRDGRLRPGLFARVEAKLR